jgi:hypothetical protein
VSDRIPSDHGTVDSHRVRLATVGRTGRPRVPLPEDLDCASDDVVSLSLEGDRGRAHVATDLSGKPVIDGVYANARLARADDEGDNALTSWVAGCGLSADDPLLVDVLASGYAYGLRRPGERVVYRAVDPPDASLAEIARELDE